MRRLSRFRRLLILGLCAVSGASAKAQTPGTGSSLPSLSGFTPNQGAQGSVVNIIFTGNNFVGKGLGLQFSPAAGLKVGNLQAVSSTQISAQVQIDAGAQLGPHAVLLIVADHSLQSNIPFIVTAPACGTPGTPPCPGEAPPILRAFSPLQGTQGSNLMVTFTGANFSGSASAVFTPGAGITVQSTTVVNGNLIEAQLAIDANAPLGARSVSLIVGKTRLLAQNTFTVVEGGERQRPPAAVQILRVIPNQVPAGSEGIELTLVGTNFVPGTMVNFSTSAGLATDVFVAGASRYVNSTELHVVVNVLPSALPGGRDINLQTPSRPSVTGKGMLNVLAPAPSSSKKTAPPALVKITPIGLQKFSKGIIRLDA